MEYIIAITGATGAIYGVRLLRRIAQAGATVHLVISPTGAKIVADELGFEGDLRSPQAARLAGEHAQRVVWHAHEELTAPIASGSYPCAGMAICPCSMGTLGRIASGVSSDLVARAADVMLKERRPLVLVVREAPLSVIHLKNMLAVAEAGAIVLPAAPVFYTKPKTIDELVDTVVARAAKHLGLSFGDDPQWRGRER